MTREEFDSFCASLPATTHVIQWGGASVWKVGGKIFAISSVWKTGENERVSFKASDFSYEILRQQPGLAPAPYLARAKWVQVQRDDALSEEELKAYLREAHRLIAAKLTRAVRKDLGL